MWEYLELLESQQLLGKQFQTRAAAAHYDMSRTEGDIPNPEPEPVAVARGEVLGMEEEGASFRSVLRSLSMQI